MKTKLNLSVDPEILKEAREWGKREGISISKLFEKLIRMHSAPDSDRQDWLDSFYKRNRKRLDKISNRDIEFWLKERGKKY